LDFARKKFRLRGTVDGKRSQSRSAITAREKGRRLCTGQLEGERKKVGCVIAPPEKVINHKGNKGGKNKIDV